MTDKEILEKAIQKAIDGGWKHETVIPWKDGYGVQKLKSVEHLKEFDIEHIIFNHDFAKALWGEKFTNPEMRDDNGTKIIRCRQTAWRHHLRQMVIADDPIAYLGEHLDD